MPRHSSIVRQFWDDMNRHNNARYRKVDSHSVLELERHKVGRARLVAWVKTDTGWGKMAGTWGDYDKLEPLFRELSTTDRWTAPERIKSFEDNPRLSA